MLQLNKSNKKLRTIIGAALILAMTALTAGEALAVSSAAALYLRLAAGARPSGMGDAFIAISDDATATHWNPAGLGTAPLSSVWNETSVPAKYRPLTQFVSRGRGSATGGFDGFEGWALSAKGLVRFDGSKWLTHHVYEADPDEDLETIVRRYLQINDNDAVAEAVAKVARYNNARSLEFVSSLQEQVMEALDEESSEREEIANLFVTVSKNYNRCQVNWKRFDETVKRFGDDMRDGKLDAKGIDRLTVGLERSIRRYLPEYIYLPFDLSFAGELTALEIVGKFIWVGSTDGLYRYDGRAWTTYRVSAEAEESAQGTIPSNNITAISVLGKRIFVGTDKGLVEHFGISWTPVGVDAGLPQGRVDAVILTGHKRGWAVVDGDVYQLTDGVWRNYSELTVGVDHTFESIAENFAIYGTESEKIRYIEKLTALNSSPSADVSAENGSTEEITEETAEESTEEITEEITEESAVGFTIGEVIKAPIVAAIKGEVTALYASGGRLWVGTGQGLLYYDGTGWTRYGYRAYTPEAPMTVTEIALEITKGDSARALTVAAKIREQNDLDFDKVEAGRTIWVYRNMAGSRINDIKVVNGNIYVASERGAMVFDGERLTRLDEGGLGSQEIVAVYDVDGSLWFATSGRIMFLRQPRRHLSMMHSKWLPELSDDLSYNFISYVQNVRGVGTFGISLSYFDYGSIQRTTADGTPDGTEAPADFALAISYGIPMGSKTSLGATFKYLNSNLATVGAGLEIGAGKATGYALDFGVLHRFTDRISIGAALTNLGPKLAYVDAQQADPLPLNLGVGFAWKAWKSESISLLLIGDGNNVLVEDKFEPVFNGGAEITYANLIAFRVGRINDNAGDIKTFTFGAGLRLNIPGIGLMPIDLSYIPSDKDLALANTLKTSASLVF